MLNVQTSAKFAFGEAQTRFKENSSNTKFIHFHGPEQPAIETEMAVNLDGLNIKTFKCLALLQCLILLFC